MDAVRVSVIIPTWNRAEFIGAAIDSALTQTIGGLEVIVIDDASTDGTLAVLADYGDRIRVLRTSSRAGTAAAVNLGVASARGTFVALLDSDDMWRADKLARQLALLDRTPQAGFAYGNVVFLDGDREGEPALAAGRMPSGRILDALAHDMFVHPSTLVVRRTLLASVGGIDPSVGVSEYYDLLLRLAAVSEAVPIEEPIAVVRRHVGQASRVSILANYHSAIGILERVAADERHDARIRRTARQSIGRHHVTAARLLLAAGRRREARRHLRQAAAHAPFFRSVWSTAARALLPRA